MPDFGDVPDLPQALVDQNDPSLGELLTRFDRPSITRREQASRKTLAIGVSVSWLIVQVAAFGVRADLTRLSPAYIAVLMIAPISVGFVALIVANRSGTLSLGSRPELIAVLAVVAPLSFVFAVALTSLPYSSGVVGDLAAGARCLDCIFLWALLPLVVMGFAHYGTFVVGVGWRSSLLGGGCGLMAAGFFGLHCPLVGKAHLALAHGGALLLAACVGGVCIPRLTRI